MPVGAQTSAVTLANDQHVYEIADEWEVSPTGRLRSTEAITPNLVVLCRRTIAAALRTGSRATK